MLLTSRFELKSRTDMLNSFVGGYITPDGAVGGNYCNNCYIILLDPMHSLLLTHRP